MGSRGRIGHRAATLLLGPGRDPAGRRRPGPVGGPSRPRRDVETGVSDTEALEGEEVGARRDPRAAVADDVRAVVDAVGRIELTQLAVGSEPARAGVDVAGPVDVGRARDVPRSWVDGGVLACEPRSGTGVEHDRIAGS